MKSNRFGGRAKGRRSLLGMGLPIGLFVAVVTMFTWGVGYLVEANESEAMEAARLAVTRATVQFYALEGRYPPSLSYLEERFGLQLDHDRFIIHYNAFASNVMPQITVLPNR